MEKVTYLFKRIQLSLEKNQVTGFFLKPKQVACFDYLLQGVDVLAVLPTGFGKSLLFHLLPELLPRKSENNIVIVVCPLNSIIEDQIKILTGRNIPAAVLQLEHEKTETLFGSSATTSTTVQQTIPSKVQEGEVNFLFSHPESLLSPDGRSLLKSEVYQRNVVACVIDEAHCIDMW